MLKMIVHVTALHRARSSFQHTEINMACIYWTLMSCKRSCACCQLVIAAVKVTVCDHCYTWNAGQMGGQNTEK